MKKNLLYFVLILFSCNTIQAQDTIDDNAMALLEKAMAPIDGSAGAIYFHRIAYEQKEPAAIFTASPNDVFENCYYIFDGNQFEVNLGEVQSMSDGELFVLIQKSMGQVYIDSLQRKAIDTEGIDVIGEFNKMFETEFGNSTLSLEGEESIHNVRCKKIKASFSGSPDFVLYWIDAVKGTLMLLAEYQQNAYTVYWVKEMTGQKAEHNYTIHLPDKEIESFYGFTVFDMRFADQNLYRKIKDMKPSPNP